MRPCSMETEASDGKPMTSPTAKTVGALVRKSLSTGMRPRESASTPAAARFSSSTLPWRPTAYSRASPWSFFLGFEVGDDGAVGHLFDGLYLFVEAHGDARVAEVVAEGFDDLLVGELEQARAPLDEGDADAERGEHAGVLDADDAAADDDHGLRQVDEVEHQVGVDDGACR